MKNAPLQPEKLQLDPSSTTGVRYFHADKPGTVIKTTGDFEYDDEGYAYSGEELKNETVKGLRKAKQLFRELTDDYKVKTAGFEPVMGHTYERNVGAIYVTAKIAGESYSPTDTIPDDKLPAAQQLLKRLTRYLLDKHTEEGQFLSDIGSIEQYVFDPESQDFVLVDIDPYISQGYKAEGNMLSNMSIWATRVLQPEEFEAWHSEMVAQIKPLSEPLHA